MCIVTNYTENVEKTRCPQKEERRAKIRRGNVKKTTVMVNQPGKFKRSDLKRLMEGCLKPRRQRT